MDLDDAIEAAVRAGRSNQARVLSDVRSRVVAGLDEATGGLYHDARSQFRSDSAIINALDDGRQLFNKATRPDDVLALVQQMPAAERDAFRISARDAIDEVMGNARNDALSARSLLSKDWNQQKLTALVGRQQADELLSILDRETRFAETYSATQRGSQTRERIAAGKEFPSKVETPDVPSVAGRTIMGTLEQLGRGAIRSTRSASQARRIGREASDAASLLTAQGSSRDRIVQALMDAQTQSRVATQRGQTAQNIVTLLSQSQLSGLQNRVTRYRTH